MPTRLNEEDGVLAVHVTGKLVKADYGHFVPEFADSSCSTENCACCST
jgi:hypothetical protein